jgi:quercetin dioxygenase-like cupin family protein
MREGNERMTEPRWRRVDHREVAVVPSPSGLPTQHLVSEKIGSEALFVAQQWLRPGDRVLFHTHPVDEVLILLAGSGEARLDDDTVSVGAGVTLFIPAEIPHGFRNIGTEQLHVVVFFPGGRFAETRLLEPLVERNREGV